MRRKRSGGSPRIAGSQPRVARGVTTDSRAVVPGCTFLALRGQNHDGHEYLAAATRRGRRLLVAERGRAPVDSRADTVEERRHVVRVRAPREGPPPRLEAGKADARVVAITGSAGKTTTKELCAALLRTTAGCLSTRGNLNNRVGLPSVAFQVEASHRFAVLEMGMSVRGEIAALSAVAEPDVAILTNVGLAHAEGVGGTTADVAREKGALFAALREGGVAVVNADDAHATVRRRAASRRASPARASVARRQPTSGSSTASPSEWQARDSTSPEGEEATPSPGSIPGGGRRLALCRSPRCASRPPSDRRSPRTPSKLRQPPALGPIAGRMQVRAACARASWCSTTQVQREPGGARRAAVGTLREVAVGRRLAVLGEMRELGEGAEREHESLGEFVAESGVDLLISCGGPLTPLAREPPRDAG